MSVNTFDENLETSETKRLVDKIDPIETPLAGAKTMLRVHFSVFVDIFSVIGAPRKVLGRCLGAFQ